MACTTPTRIPSTHSEEELLAQREAEALEVLEAELEEEEVLDPPELKRVPPGSSAQSADKCDNCGGYTKLHLVLTFNYNYLTLCSECEVLVLSFWLGNYVRRLSRGKSLPLPKAPEEAEDET
jgi:hypothetical protein